MLQTATILSFHRPTVDCYSTSTRLVSNGRQQTRTCELVFVCVCLYLFVIVNQRLFGKPFATLGIRLVYICTSFDCL